MNFSPQTALLVVGVTFLHLLAIAVLAPPGELGGNPEPRRPLATLELPDLEDEALFVGPEGEAAPAPAAAQEETFADPDPPARRREGAAPEAPASDPVADARTIPDGDLRPRPFSPLPRS